MRKKEIIYKDIALIDPKKGYKEKELIELNNKGKKFKEDKNRKINILKWILKIEKKGLIGKSKNNNKERRILKRGPKLYK